MYGAKLAGIASYWRPMLMRHGILAQTQIEIPNNSVATIAYAMRTHSRKPMLVNDVG